MPNKGVKTNAWNWNIPEICPAKDAAEVYFDGWKIKTVKSPHHKMHNSWNKKVIHNPVVVWWDWGDDGHYFQVDDHGLISPLDFPDLVWGTKQPGKGVIVLVKRHDYKRRLEFDIGDTWVELPKNEEECFEAEWETHQEVHGERKDECCC